MLEDTITPKPQLSSLYCTCTARVELIVKTV